MIIPIKVVGSDVTRQNGNGCGTAASETERMGEQSSINDVPQWSMVELQGELVSNDPLSGQALGSMRLENVSCVVFTFLDADTMLGRYE